MNYVYDILTNFNENFYDFYDWNLNDDIMHIRRIPIIKIENYKLNEIKNNIVKFNEEFLSMIKNRTEFFLGRGIKIIKYACLLTDGMDIFGINIGENLKYTSLQIDEELDILESVSFKEYDLKYQIVEKKEMILKTRCKIEQEKKIKQKLESLYKENNISKIKYLYYECFNQKENKVSDILTILNNSLDNCEVLEKLSNFFDLHQQIN